MATTNRETLRIVDTPSRNDRIETYLRDTSDTNAEDMAISFCEREKPLSSTVVLIPVAAEQEAAHIHKAMAAYAGQTDCDPFTIALLLNYRSGISYDRLLGVQESIKAVELAKRTYRDTLDIRFAVQQYDDPTIGHIRKDLWDAALMLAATEGAFDDESSYTIGISHDIDTDSMEPHYIRNVQQDYKAEQQQAALRHAPGIVLTPRHTKVRHTLPFKTHPNTSDAIFWADYSVDHAEPFVGYEEGLVLPFSYYANAGGFRRESRVYETRPLTCSVTRNISFVQDAEMRTSPRRYIKRFPEYGFGGIWQEGSFTDADECRELEYKGRDATREELEIHVDNALDEYIINLYLKPALERTFGFIRARDFTANSDELLDQYKGEVRAELDQKLSTAILAARAGLTLMRLSHLGKNLRTDFDIEGIAEAHAARIRKVRNSDNVY